MEFMAKMYVTGYYDGDTIETEDGLWFSTDDMVDGGKMAEELLADVYFDIGKAAYDEAQYMEDIEVEVWIEMFEDELYAFLPTSAGDYQRVAVDTIDNEYMREVIYDTYSLNK